jgi:hypothetical protein
MVKQDTKELKVFQNILKNLPMHAWGLIPVYWWSLFFFPRKSGAKPPLTPLFKQQTEELCIKRNPH